MDVGLAFKAATEHELVGDRLLGQGLPPKNRGHASVAHDRDSIGVLDQIAEAVGHQDYHATGIGKAMDLAEQLIRLIGGEGRVGFVEKKHPGLAREGARDFGALLGRERATAERPCGEIGDPESRHEIGVMLAQLWPEDTGALATGHQVF